MKVLIDSNFYSSLIRETHFSSLPVVFPFSSLRGVTTKQSQYRMNPADNKETTSEYLVVTSQKGALKNDKDSSSFMDGNTISSLPVVSPFSSLRGGTTKQSQYRMNPVDNKETTSEYLVVTSQEGVLQNDKAMSSLMDGNTTFSLRGSMTKQSQNTLTTEENNNENLQSYFIIEIKKKYSFSVIRNSVMEKNNYGN